MINFDNATKCNNTPALYQYHPGSSRSEKANALLNLICH